MNAIQRLASALDGSTTSPTPPATGGPSWCRSCLIERVKSKATTEIEALRKWRDEFRTLEHSFDGLMQGGASSRRAAEIIDSLGIAEDGEQFRELTSELRLIELAKGPHGGPLRQAAHLRLARKFAEVEPLLGNLVSVAERELDKLASDAESRESKAADALQDLLGVAQSPSPLTAKVEAARARFEGLLTQFSTQYNASHWNGRNPGFMEWLLA